MRAPTWRPDLGGSHVRAPFAAGKRRRATEPSRRRPARWDAAAPTRRFPNTWTGRRVDTSTHQHFNWAIDDPSTHAHQAERLRGRGSEPSRACPVSAEPDQGSRQLGRGREMRGGRGYKGVGKDAQGRCLREEGGGESGVKAGKEKREAQEGRDWESLVSQWCWGWVLLEPNPVKVQQGRGSREPRRRASPRFVRQRGRGKRCRKGVRVRLALRHPVGKVV
uniref:Uncharacterized protein n=1 Tax=Sphaerodactylus townsendi TaxID=933632 RepID=A0ACB8F0N3_9SAUR